MSPLTAVPKIVGTDVVRSVKAENAATTAATSAGEAKKGVSWGTITTHKVCAVETTGDNNVGQVNPSASNTLF